MASSESNQIYEAFKFSRQVGEEIDALQRAVKDELLKASEQPGAKYSLEVSDDEQKPPHKSGYWICEAWCESYLVSEKRKSKSLGYLYYLYDLSCENGPADKLEQALILVGYTSKRTSSEHPQKMSIDAFYPWEPTIPDEMEKRWTLGKDHKIWYWTGGTPDLSDMENTCWVYFVPLAAIHSQREVVDVLVAPALGLLTNRQQTLTNIASVISFTDEKFERGKKD